MFDEILSEYERRIEALLAMTPPERRPEVIVQLAAGVAPAEVFDWPLERLRFLPHLDALKKRTEKLAGDVNWPARRAKVLTGILERQIDAETRRRVLERITRPLPSAPRLSPIFRGRANDESILEVALLDEVTIDALRALMSRSR